MKIVLLLILIAGATFLYFKSDKKTTTPETANESTSPQGEEVSKDVEGTFVVDGDTSSAKWTGSKKIIKNYYDSGTIVIKSGSASFDQGIVTKGEVVFDMKSITATSTGKGDGQDKLTSHLQSDDFFAVTTHPEAKYVVTSSEKTSSGILLKGNLTLKGKTAPLDIPAVVTMDNGNVVIIGTAEVNRSTWDVKYGSETFFDNLGDNVINDMFTLEFKVVARP